MAWTGQTFSPGQVLTATQMNNLQADITAQANGDTSAPKNKLASMDTDSVDSSQIVASAVAQGKLKSTTGQVSVTGSNNLTLAGGEYGFYPQLKVGAATTMRALMGSGISNTSYVTNIYLNRTSGSGICYAQHRYIQASPPYDMGDGEVPLFIFLLVDTATREIVATYIAPEAPWHYNGPTSIKADLYQDGKPFQKVKIISPEAEAIRASAMSAKDKMRTNQPITDEERSSMIEFFRVMEDQQYEMQEITQDIKQADMSLVPHPFPNATAGQTVILVDPLSTITENLFYALSEDDSSFEVTSMFNNNFFDIDTTPLTRSGPEGVIQLGFNWRQT